MIAAMQEGVAVQDADGRIIACNASAERILGLTADQLMGSTSRDPRWRAVDEHGAPVSGEQHPAAIVRRTGRPQSNVILGVHKPDGILVWVLVNARPVVASDGASTQRRGDHVRRHHRAQAGRTGTPRERAAFPPALREQPRCHPPDAARWCHPGSESRCLSDVRENRSGATAGGAAGGCRSRRRAIAGRVGRTSADRSIPGRTDCRSRRRDALSGRDLHVLLHGRRGRCADQHDRARLERATAG